MNNIENDNSGYANVESGYQVSAPVIIRPVFPTDLEKFLNANYQVHSDNDKGILNKLFSDKSKSLKATVNALSDEIKLREGIDSLLINEIDDEISNLKTQMVNLPNTQYLVSPEYSRDIGKNKKHLENSILELEREKRKGCIENWRDLMFMNKYLHSAFKDYWELVKKRELLSSDVTDLLKNENIKGY